MGKDYNWWLIGAGISFVLVFVLTCAGVFCAGFTIMARNARHTLDEAAAAHSPPGDMEMKAYILQKPDKPTAIRVKLQMTNNYHFEFRNSAESHYSFRSQEESANLYAPKNSEYGKRLYEMLKDGSSRELTLLIQRVGPSGQPLPQDDYRCYSIVGIVDGSSANGPFPKK